MKTQTKQTLEQRRNAVLLHMVAQGWHNEATQDADCPFARISINAQDATDVVAHFGTTLNDYDVTVADLAGHHLVEVRDEDTISVHSFPVAQAVIAAYNRRQAAWLKRRSKYRNRNA